MFRSCRNLGNGLLILVSLIPVVPNTHAIDFAVIARTAAIDFCEQVLEHPAPEAAHDPRAVEIRGQLVPESSEFLDWAMAQLGRDLSLEREELRVELREIQGQIGDLERQENLPTWRRDERYQRGRFLQFLRFIFFAGDGAEERRLDDDLREAEGQAAANRELLEFLDRARDTKRIFASLIRAMRPRLAGSQRIDLLNEQIFQWLLFRFFSAWNEVAELLDDPEGDASDSILGRVEAEFETLRGYVTQHRDYLISVNGRREVPIRSPIYDEYLDWKADRLGDYLRHRVKEVLPEGRGINDEQIGDLLDIAFKNQVRIARVARLFAEVDVDGAEWRKDSQGSGEIQDHFDMILTDIGIRYDKSSSELIARFREIDEAGLARFGSSGIHDRYIPMLVELSYEYDLTAEELMDYLEEITARDEEGLTGLRSNHGALVYLLRTVLKEVRKGVLGSQFSGVAGLVMDRYLRAYRSGAKNPDRPEHTSWTVFPMATAILVDTALENPGMTELDAVDEFFETVDAIKERFEGRFGNDEDIARLVEFKRHYHFSSADELFKLFNRIHELAGGRLGHQRRMTILAMIIVRDPRKRDSTELHSRDFSDQELIDSMNFSGFEIMRTEDFLVCGETLAANARSRRRSTPASSVSRSSYRSSYGSSSDDDFGGVGFGFDITGGGFGFGIKMGSGMVIGF